MGAKPEHKRVAAAIQIAADTAHKLAGRWPGPQYACVWDSLMSMAPIDDSYPEDKRIRVYPTAGELHCLDAVTEWMLPLSIPARKILWYRADGNRWRWIAARVGLAPRYCQKIWQDSANLIIANDIQGILTQSEAIHAVLTD